MRKLTYQQNEMNCIRWGAFYQAEVRECLLLFGAESSVIQVAVQKFKDQDILNYNYARCPEWV